MVSNYPTGEAAFSREFVSLVLQSFYRNRLRVRHHEKVQKLAECLIIHGISFLRLHRSLQRNQRGQLFDRMDDRDSA